MSDIVITLPKAKGVIFSKQIWKVEKIRDLQDTTYSDISTCHLNVHLRSSFWGFIKPGTLFEKT